MKNMGAALAEYWSEMVTRFFWEAPLDPRIRARLAAQLHTNTH